jgi:hypothetical protein
MSWRNPDAVLIILSLFPFQRQDAKNDNDTENFQSLYVMVSFKI